MFSDRRGHNVTEANKHFVKAKCGMILNSRYLQYAREDEHCSACLSAGRRH